MTMRSLAWLALLIISACSSAERRQTEFQAIEIGMTKSQVIATAGAPYWSDRKKGHDRWTYYMDPIKKNVEKVVYFRENRVVSKGDRIRPLLTAEEMERLKKPSPSETSYKPKLSDKELEAIIKKEIKKKAPAPKDNFEPI